MRKHQLSPEALKEFALNVCLVLAAVLVVTGVAKVYAPAGFIAAGLALAAAGWWFFTGQSDEESPQ